uniref:Cystine knot toxin n=2 Tax=Dolomedes mizhoanus TaxID=1366394 RepID=S5N3Q8_9ARAC|nr:cystine knot toxin [Dolomedes mizhoanus]
MKTLLVFISVLYLVHSFSLEVEDEALQLLEAEDTVDEEQRACIQRGQSCKSDCDCCADDWDQCNFWGTCVAGTASDCFDKKKNCKVKPKKCVVAGQNKRNQG